MSKKPKLPRVPRTIEEITKEYNECRVALADSEYVMFVQNKECLRLKGRMLELNNEAHERKNLDAQKKEDSNG